MDQKPGKGVRGEGVLPLPHPPEEKSSSAGSGIETRAGFGGWNPEKKITTIGCFARILRGLKKRPHHYLYQFWEPIWVV